MRVMHAGGGVWCCLERRRLLQRIRSCISVTAGSKTGSKEEKTEKLKILAFELNLGYVLKPDTDRYPMS